MRIDDRRGSALAPALRRVLPHVEDSRLERGIKVDDVTVYQWAQTFTSDSDHAT